MLDNRNITDQHLGRSGLHLNKPGSSHLAETIFLSYGNFDGLWNTQMNLQRDSMKIMLLGHLLIATL